VILSSYDVVRHAGIIDGFRLHMGKRFLLFKAIKDIESLRQNVDRGR